MYSFIPEEDRAVFERFLRDQNLEPMPTPRAVSKSEGLPSPTKVGARKRGGHNRPVTDIDKFLHDIDSQMDSMLEDTTNF